MIRSPKQTMLEPAVLADFECHHQNQPWRRSKSSKVSLQR